MEGTSGIMEWYNVPREEQETTINIDYEERTLVFYTTRKNVATKLAKKVGEPDKVYTTDEKVSAIEYKRKLSDKNIRYFLSVGIIIAGFKQDIE